MKADVDVVHVLFLAAGEKARMIRDIGLGRIPRRTSDLGRTKTKLEDQPQRQANSNGLCEARRFDTFAVQGVSEEASGLMEERSVDSEHRVKRESQGVWLEERKQGNAWQLVHFDARLPDCQIAK